MTTSPKREPDIDAWSDARLVGAVGRAVARPKVDPADSFVLHAPLELLARYGLLRHVRQEVRRRARNRILQLGAQYVAAGPSVPDPSPPAFDCPADAASTLIAAISAGDLDAVDRAADALGASADPGRLRRLLAEPIAASLAAAGHGSILLYLLARVSAGGEITRRILRGAARELARSPDWKLRWFDDPEVAGPRSERVAVTHRQADRHAGSERRHQSGSDADGSLLGALLDVPILGSPGSDFIYPVMRQAEESGLAPELLSGIIAVEPDIGHARVQLARVAAWSMLQEPPDHARYGWSHCLTMPQAVIGVAGDGAAARSALAVAATYVVGFRAALGKRAIVPSFAPEPTRIRGLPDAIGAGRDAAASWVWHAPTSALAGVRAELAGRAAAHHDAHLVKYTLACFDATAVDPDGERLYLAAAASLSAFWAALPADDPAEADPVEADPAEVGATDWIG